MAVSPILGIELTAPTQGSKTVTLNSAIVALEAASNAVTAVDMSGGDVTLSFAQFTAAAVFKTTGLTATRKLTIPLTTPAAGPAERVFLVRNASSHSLTVGGVTGATVSIAAGDATELESDGTDTIAYGSGGPGAPGPAGPPGGAIDISYTFSTSTSTADPGNGEIAFDHSTQNLTTHIFVDTLDSAGSDWTTVLDSLDDSTSAVKGQLRIFNRSDTTKWILFNLTAVGTATHYRNLTVVPVGSSASNPFSASDGLGFSFTRSGDSDTSILTQNNVWTKSQQQTITALTDATTIAIDFAAGDTFSVTLGGNRLLANPSNMPGSGITQAGQIFVIQDGTGGRTLSYDTQWHAVGGTAPAIATAAGAISVISYVVINPTYIKFSVLVG